MRVGRAAPRDYPTLAKGGRTWGTSKSRSLALLGMTLPIWAYTRESKALESVNPRDGRAQDQGVDIVGSFVGLDRLQVRQVAEDRVFVGYAVGA